LADQEIREGCAMTDGSAGKKEIWWEDELDLAPVFWPSARRRWPSRAWGWVGLMAACPALFVVASGSVPRGAPAHATAMRTSPDRTAVVTVLTFAPRRDRAVDIDSRIIVLRSEEMDRRIIVRVEPEMDRRIVAEIPDVDRPLNAIRLRTFTIEDGAGAWLAGPTCRAG
jgi:hypothetical protein